MIIATLALALIGAFSPVSAVSPAQAASSGTSLPFDDFQDVVADPVADLAYVSGGLADGQVVVVNHTGAIVRTLGDLPYPVSIALSADAQTLYVAESHGANVIVAVDLRTGLRTTFPVGEHGVYDLAVAGDDVWFTAYEELSHDAPLGRLDPATGTVTTGLGPSDIGDSQRLVSDPHDPNVLFMANDHVYRLDITPTAAGEPQARATAVQDLMSGGPHDLRVSADGARVITTRGVLDADSLVPVDSYPSVEPRAVAVRSDGAVALGGGSLETDDLYVYGPDQTTFASHTGYSGLFEYVEYRGLAFGSTTLFSVTDQSNNDNPLTIYASEPTPQTDPIGSSTLDVPGIDGIVNDSSHHQSFIGTGSEGNGIIVVDDRGEVTRVLHHLPSVQQMALSGDTLWASVAGTDTIAAIDTRTYAVRLYPVPDFFPEGIAATDGLVWFTAYSRVENGGDSYTGALDPSTGTITRVLDGDQYHLLANPAFPHRLYAFGNFEPPGPFDGSRFGSTLRYAVTGGSHPALRIVTHGRLGSDLEDAAISSNLKYLAYAAPYGPSKSASADITTLKPTKVSPGYDSAGSVAARSDGLIATGFGDFNTTYPPYGVYLRQGAVGRPVGTRLPSGAVVTRGLAFAGRDLLAVTQENEGGYAVRDVPMPALRR